MSIWSEGFEVRADAESGLSTSAVYYAGSNASPRTFWGPFNELAPATVTDDRQGRNEARQGLLELPLSDALGPIQLAMDGKEYFEIRDRRWKPERVMQGRGHWCVYLSLVSDQSIRMLQSSTRR